MISLNKVATNKMTKKGKGHQKSYSVRISKKQMDINQIKDRITGIDDDFFSQEKRQQFENKIKSLYQEDEQKAAQYLNKNR
jgi:hypothetical protein